MRSAGKLLVGFIITTACCVCASAWAAPLTDGEAVHVMADSDKLFHSGKYAAGIAMLEDLLTKQLSPKSESQARTTLASMYSASGDVKKAIELVRQAFQLDPSNERIVDYLEDLEIFQAKQLMGAGHYDAAMEHYEFVLKFDPDEPEALHGLASAYEGKGDLKNAKLFLKRFASVTRSKEAAQAVKDRLPRLQQLMDVAGSPDADSYFTAVSTPYLCRWSLAQMPLHVYIEPTSSVPNFSPEYAKSISRAMDLWCAATNGKLSWMPVPEDGTADIVVRFSANPEEVGQSKSHIEAGICYTNMKRMPNSRIGGLTRANIKLLTTRPNGDAVSSQEMQDTAAHEIGHALGLREHSANPDDVMFFAVTHNTKSGLTKRDINTIRDVYEAKVYDDGSIVLDGKKLK